MHMTDLVETMNNKIHDGDDGMEIGDGDNILPVAMVRQIERHRSFLEVFRQKNVPAGFSMSSSYILFTDSKTVLG